MTELSGLPFTLPERPLVTKIRKCDTRTLNIPGPMRTQPMRGFEDQFTDIVDYIVRITNQIWPERQVGRIYDTYDANCVVYSATGTVHSVEEVVAATTATINAAPDGESHHLNVAWSGNEDDGFYTSHLGFSLSTNLGASAYGPATGRRIGRFFIADCVSQANLIHTEWLMRDNGAAVRQMGFDMHEVAQRLAGADFREERIVVAPTRLDGQSPRTMHGGAVETVEDWAERHFNDIWNMRRFDLVTRDYAPQVIAHWCSGRIAHGLRNLQALIIALLASVPNGSVRVEHVSWSEETDGVIVAVRWTLEGATAPGGLLGDAPAGGTVAIMGASHFRFVGGLVVEEWTIFDEVGALVQAYRG